MFEDGNRVRFDLPVDDLGRKWWLDAFLGPFDLTPEDMGDLLTKSVGAEKRISYRYIDGARHAFALRVEGRFGDGGDVWYVERSLELEGSLFNADAMFIPANDAGGGRGRRLMGDLIEASARIGVARIAIEAQLIGRYAWLRAGFVPDSASWRNIQIDAIRFVQRHGTVLGGKADEILTAIMRGGPTTARWLAALDDLVPSRELHQADGQPVMVPIGKALFLEAVSGWTGAFTFDPESRRIADDYIGAADQS